LVLKPNHGTHWHNGSRTYDDRHSSAVASTVTRAGPVIVADAPEIVPGASRKRGVPQTSETEDESPKAGQVIYYPTIAIEERQKKQNTLLAEVL
jgi:hypothetical protein